MKLLWYLFFSPQWTPHRNRASEVCSQRLSSNSADSITPVLCQQQFSSLTICVPCLREDAGKDAWSDLRQNMWAEESRDHVLPVDRQILRLNSFSLPFYSLHFNSTSKHYIISILAVFLYLSVSQFPSSGSSSHNLCLWLFIAMHLFRTFYHPTPTRELGKPSMHPAQPQRPFETEMMDFCPVLPPSRKSIPISTLETTQQKLLITQLWERTAKGIKGSIICRGDEWTGQKPDGNQANCNTCAGLVQAELCGSSSCFHRESIWPSCICCLSPTQQETQTSSSWAT